MNSLMDDSDQDFSFLCSRLLKRVRRKGGESADEKKIVEKDVGGSGSRTQSRSKAPCKRKREKKGLQSKSTDRIHAEGRGNEESETAPVTGEGPKEQKMRAKDKVLSRMQRFKRATPPRLVHTEEEARAEGSGQPAETEALPIQDSFEKQDGDMLLAQRLQQQLDRKAENQALVDVEDSGLFFCQLCHKDLSAMSHQLRTQHINRCLDKHEISTSHVPAPRTRIPECPICGRVFKSEKTRSTHLKRCSATMGVSPAELLKALHRQAAERENQQQAGGSSDTSSKPVKKKARKNRPHLDEYTMVALALSRSLLEQEKEREKDREEERHMQLTSVTSGPAPLVQLRAGAGKSRVKKRKGDPDAPPPLLLVQNPQAAQNRIQERVASLLLLPRPPTPPTPPLLPSKLSTNTLLWLKSALPGGGPASIPEFYTAELGAFIQPVIGSGKKKSPSSHQVTPVKQLPAAGSESTRAPEQPDTSAPHHPSTPSLGTPGTQAVTDLVDLAEEGMTLTQYKSTDAETPLSGFVLEPTETSTSTSVSRLCCDLGSMVNNPQLSDVQLQVDSGEVYFAHSFMLYTRCPLLANVIHDEGFGVQEEGFSQAQRVLLDNVSGEAVYALLQYLYTAVCHLTHSLLPDVFQLASRFGLSELQQQCEQYSGIPAEDPAVEEIGAFMTHKRAAEPQQSLVHTTFLELLRSMWEHEDGDDEEAGGATKGIQGQGEEKDEDGDTKEDIVDEDEMNEIYEFAATQREMGTEAEVSTESGDGEADESVKDNCSGSEQKDNGKQNVEIEKVHSSAELDSNRGSDNNLCQNRGLDASLDKSYNHLFSESWGEYTEPSRTPTQRPDLKTTLTSRCASSVSEVIDLSISPPPESEEPARSLFPVAGVSPVETLDQSEAFKQAPKAYSILQLTQELWSKHPPPSSLRLKVTNSLPSGTKPIPKPSSSLPHCSQPELIVLSDSSDDVEPDLKLPDEVPLRCYAPRPPTPSPSIGLLYKSSLTKNKKNTQVELSPKISNESPGSVNPEPFKSDQVSNENILDGSAEVSWLIPATPVPSTRTSTTETCSSMRRIQLFPRSHSSSSSSNSDNPKTTSCSNTPRETVREPHKELSQPSLAFQNLPSHFRSSKTPSQGDSFNRTYPNSLSEFCSSTPLHSDPPLQQLDPLGSPLLSDSALKTQPRAGQEGKLESLYLSPSENSLSPRRNPQSEKESSPSKSQHTEIPGASENQEMSAEEREAVETRKSKTNEAEVMEERFSFVFDEPPIAFDDSWGLGGAMAQQGPQFSLRLETSGDQTSPPEQSRQGETASLHTSFSPSEAQSNLPEHESPLNHSLPDAAMWDSWKEDNEDKEEVDALPLSQRLGAVAIAKRVTELRTPVACKQKNLSPLVPITPMPSFSDMDTPDLKNRLNRYGVRPLPKKQMVLKLKEIHQYTHQLMSSGSEEETSPKNRPRAAPAAFKHPTAPPPVSPRKLLFEKEEAALPASQESNTSSTPESERSNPEMCDSDGDGSDSEGITASQAAVGEKDKLQAVRSFILSDPVLYGRVLQYQPLALSELKAGLRKAGVRLGTAKLLDFLDSQCITFTTAKQGHPVPSHRRARGAGRGRKKLAVR